MVSVKLNCKTLIIICLVYIRPHAKLEYYTCIFNYLSTLLSQNRNIILLGDFNLPDIDWNSLSGHSPYSIQLCKLVFQYNLTQFITFPTHVMGNILDLILSDNIDLISNTTSVSSQSSLLTSDHYAISFCVSTSPTKQPSHSGSKYIMDYSQADWTGLTSYLLSTISPPYTPQPILTFSGYNLKRFSLTLLNSSYLRSKLKILLTQNGSLLKSGIHGTKSAHLDGLIQSHHHCQLTSR